MASPPLPPVPIAVVGTGLIGPRHCEAIAQDPDAVLSCVVDPNPAAEAVATRFGVPWYQSVQEMLVSRMDERPRAALICTPNSTHVKVSKELLDGGLHVLVEKPISIDIESGKELVSHARSKNLHLLVGHHRRFNQYIIGTKKILDSGSLGRVVAINGLWATYKPTEYFDPPTEWRRTGSAGPVWINLIHDVDLLHHLFGPITRVHAEKATSQRKHEADEGAAIILRFASGVVGTFLLSDAVPSPFNFEAGTGENPMIPKTGKDFYRIFGSEACLSVPDLRLWRYDKGKTSWLNVINEETIPLQDTRVPFALQIEHFVKVVRNQQEPSCSGDEGLRAVMVCDAVKRAMESGEPVNIDLTI